MSPQTQQLYRVLLSSKAPLSVKDLGDKLKIVPNSVYRLTRPLISMGLIKETKNYPTSFITNSPDAAQSLFLLNQGNWFAKEFLRDSKTTNPSFSFVQSRDELMNISIDEYKKAQKSVDLLRSGGEIPADLLLEMNLAKQRGVVTRMLIQDYSSKNKDMVENWVKNGFQVKITNLKRIRLMIYDSKIVYFMSYRHTDSDQDQGFKIDYSPLAAIMSKQFDSWWEKSKKVLLY